MGCFFLHGQFLSHVQTRFENLFRKRPGGGDSAELRRWGWRGNLLDIAKEGGGIMEVSNVAKLKAVDCLEWMSRQTALADYQEKQSKK